MRTIIFIGTNKSGSSYEAIKASESMRYYTVLLTERETFIDKRAEFPHVHLMKFCDIDDADSIRSMIDSLIESHLDIYAIVSFIDPYCHTASLLAQEFGLKYFSPDAILIMLDKIKSREILAGSPYVPFFYKIGGNYLFTKRITEEKLPLILKSPESTGSKNVYQAKTYWQYKNTISEIKRNFPHAPILVEEYLEGTQYLVETMTVNHKVNIIAIIEQEIIFTGRFIITGYKMILEHENEFYQSLKKAVDFVINRHGIKDGPCHLEIRRVNDEWKLIEVNPRISGGAMNLFIETAYGINLVKETLKIALGDEPDFENKYEKETFLQYVIVPKEGKLIKVTGRNNALNCRGVEHVYIKPKKGSVIVPPVSMAHRYAYVIATGETAGDAMEKAKHGASQIKFHLRKIDADLFSQLESSEQKLLDTADKNKAHLDRISALFDNFILYNQ